jgi:hypothetical protein
MGQFIISARGAVYLIANELIEDRVWAATIARVTAVASAQDQTNSYERTDGLHVSLTGAVAKLEIGHHLRHN